MRLFLNRRFWLGFGVLFFVAIVPLLLYAMVSAPDVNRLGEIARQTANEFDRLIELRERQVFALAALPSIRAFASSTPETRSQRAAVALNELQALVAADTNIRQVLITDATGIVIMTTAEGWNSDASARRFVQDALRGQLAVSPIARDEGEFSTYYAAPVLNNSKEIAGALVIRVAAQEFWSVTPRGENFYAVLADENGVRLDDAGDTTLRLVSFGPLDPARAARVVKEQTYGALLPSPATSHFARAQELVAQGAYDRLRASDLDAEAMAFQRLVSKPWVVLALAPQSTFSDIFFRLLLPFGVGLALAFGGAFLLARS